VAVRLSLSLSVPSLGLRFLRPSKREEGSFNKDESARAAAATAEQREQRRRRLLNQIPNVPWHSCSLVTTDSFIRSRARAHGTADAETPSPDRLTQLHHLRRRNRTSHQATKSTNTYSQCALASSSNVELGVTGYPAQGRRFTI